LAAGMDGYVSKPIQVDQLFSTIEEVLATLHGRGLGPGARDSAHKPRKSKSVSPNQFNEKPSTRSSPPNPGLGPQAPTINRAAALARVEGDSALLSELADLFLVNAPLLVGDMKQAVKKKDGQNLERAAHTLKGSVSNFEVREAYQAALKLEEAAAKEDFSTATTALKELEQILERIRPALESLRKGLPAGRQGVEA
jgi:two-component system, sensor histidine kinase and response regulator